MVLRSSIVTGCARGFIGVRGHEKAMKKKVKAMKEVKAIDKTSRRRMTAFVSTASAASPFYIAA